MIRTPAISVKTSLLAATVLLALAPAALATGACVGPACADVTQPGAYPYVVCAFASAGDAAPQLCLRDYTGADCSIGLGVTPDWGYDSLGLALCQNDPDAIGGTVLVCPGDNPDGVCQEIALERDAGIVCAVSPNPRSTYACVGVETYSNDCFLLGPGEEAYLLVQVQDAHLLFQPIGCVPGLA